MTWFFGEILVQARPELTATFQAAPFRSNSLPLLLCKKQIFGNIDNSTCLDFHSKKVLGDLAKSLIFSANQRNSLNLLASIFHLDKAHFCGRPSMPSNPRDIRVCLIEEPFSCPSLRFAVQWFRLDYDYAGM